MAAVLGVNAWVWIGFLFILYFTWEHAPWHASRATERAYMGFMTCSSALLLLYDSDSPLFYLLTDPTILALREEAARQRAAGVGGDGAAVDAPTLALHNVATAVAFGCAVLASDVLMRRRAQGVLKKIELGATGARLAAECASLHAHALARNITDHLDDLTFSSTGTAVRWYLQAGTAAKNKIYKILTGASESELNFVLIDINVAHLFSVCDERTRSLLCDPDGLLPRLRVPARATLVDALQQIGLRNSVDAQRQAAQVLLATHGADLTELKNLIDQGDFHNLFKLVYEDIADDEVRSDLLEHLVAEAEVHRAECRRGLAGEPLKILSDVDDTLYCSAARHLAGIDERFPRKSVYPGVLAFYRELDRHAMAVARRGVREPPPSTRPISSSRRSSHSPLTAPGPGAAGAERHSSPSPSRPRGMQRTRSLGSLSEAHRIVVGVRLPTGEYVEISALPDDTVSSLMERIANSRRIPAHLAKTLIGMPDFGCNLVFLSARPHAYKDYSESYSYKLFRELHESGRLYGMPTLLAGGLREGIGVVWDVIKGNTGTEIWKDVGLKKFSSFCDYRRVFAEHSFCFVGDNGQGDVLAAELMRAHAPAAVRAAFIHEVQPLPGTLSVLTGAQVADSVDEHLDEEALRPPPHLVEAADEGLAAKLRAEWERRRIFFFTTYVGAAIKAFRCGLLDEAGLRVVALAASDDLESLRVRYPHWKWRSLVKALNADIAAANDLIASGDEVPLLPMLLKERGKSVRYA